jgi:hypothetical protein
MKTINNQILEIIIDLNSELYKQYRGKEEELTVNFNYSTNGMVDVISFGDQILWDSENEPREWLEETQDYEPLKAYVIKSYYNYVALLNSIQL